MGGRGPFVELGLRQRLQGLVLRADALLRGRGLLPLRARRGGLLAGVLGAAGPLDAGAQGFHEVHVAGRLGRGLGLLDALAGLLRVDEGRDLLLEGVAEGVGIPFLSQGVDQLLGHLHLLLGDLRGVGQVGQLLAGVSYLISLTRILGAATGRSLHAHAHAHAHGLRTVQPQPIAKSAGAERSYDHDVLDPVEHRRSLLELAEGLGARLRDEHQTAGNLALSVRYADRSTSSRSRTLPEPTAHTRPLATTAYELYDLLALQRARVRAISLRAQDLRPAAEATEQLTLDPTDDRARAIEFVTDRARARYGHGTIRPAALAATGG